MSIEHDILSSQTNPNGLLAEFSRGEFGDDIEEARFRVVAATADIHSFIHNVAQVDMDMAEVITARAVREIIHSIGASVSDEVLTGIINDGIAISNSEMTDRAIEMINSRETG